mgnify:CR=1 FL=1
MPRPLSTIAPEWWDYTTLDPEIISDAGRLTARDLEQLSRPGFTVVMYDTLEQFYLAEALNDLEQYAESELIFRRLLETDASDPDIVTSFGLSLAGPTVVTHGSDEVRNRLLRPMFTGEEVWCQLFSEPGAGSDLAGLSCKAVRDGDEWIVNGQKVWTSTGQVADLGMLIARTDPDVPKHKGLTMFIVPMDAEGVTIRGLRQISGEAEFNEVFFDDVVLPSDAVVGGVGNGWGVALTVLMFERFTIPRSSAELGTVPFHGRDS